jgi:hypothetical protein
MMTTPILKYFAYSHLPEKLQAVSKPIGDLAAELESMLPEGPEKSVALRKLLEAKDAAVRAALCLALLFSLAPVADAQAPRSPELPVGQVMEFGDRPVLASPQSVTIEPAPVPASVDYGLGWINAYRASCGLHPLAYDPAMASVATINNSIQRTRGLGHHYRGDRVQNAGMGSLPTILSMWAADPPHRAILLDRSITAGAVVWDGYHATFSAR